MYYNRITRYNNKGDDSDGNLYVFSNLNRDFYYYWNYSHYC